MLVGDNMVFRHMTAANSILGFGLMELMPVLVFYIGLSVTESIHTFTL